MQLLNKLRQFGEDHATCRIYDTTNNMENAMPTQSEFQKMFQALPLETAVGPNDPVYLDYFSKLEH